jgi:putative Mg2+ transporter-C (MgtC) family protein
VDTITHPANLTDLFLRLALATAFGAAIGANREFRRKPAGLRTHALVGLGAAVLTVIGIQMEGASDQLNALSRVVQGIVVGVGFIGGGAIFHGEQQVQGLSTAAGIWIVAAAGTAAGSGMLRTAAISIFLALVILIAGEPLDRVIRNRRRDDPKDGLPLPPR